MDDDEPIPRALEDATIRAIAAALCDGSWEPRAMQARLDTVVEPRHSRDGRDEAVARAWLVTLVRAVRSAFATAPRIDELSRFIAPRTRVEGLARFRVLRVPLPAPEMRESPWDVPALATTRELAMWLGISIDALDAWARHLGDAPGGDTPVNDASLGDAPGGDAPGGDDASLGDAPGGDAPGGDAPGSDARRDAPGSEAPVGDHRVPDVRARHYRYAWIPKPRGGYRLLEAPKPRLRAVQRDLLDGILGRIPPHDAAFGVRAGRSVVDFAARHAGRETVIRLDLTAFFTSVFAPRVAGILRTAGYPDRVSRTIAALCTHRTPADVIARMPASTARASMDVGPGRATERPMLLSRLRAPHLPQGAPTSGALANLAAYRLDVRVAALAARVGATYGRYADDLVLSGDRTLAKRAPSVIARIGAIAIEEGFTLNYRKTRVMTAADQQRVVGVVVNEKPAVARGEVERLRAILHNCVRTGPDPQNRDGVVDFRAHLRGRIAWVAQLDRRKGERLQAVFDQIRWDARSS